MKKSNAMRLLDTLAIPYEMHSYATDDGVLDGLSVALKTGRDPAVVFKTLVLRGHSGGVFVFCLPVDMELPLKEAARAAGEKNLAMLPPADLPRVTGYERGGCSPLGMKKPLPTFLQKSAAGLPRILVSGGRIGLQIELAPDDLLRATQGTLLPW